MKLIRKLTLPAIAALAVYTNSSLAHDITSNFSNPGRFATDYWLITCEAGTNHLFFRVKDFTPNTSRVSAMVVKGTRVVFTTDLVDSDALLSTRRLFAQGSGGYHLFVFKSNGNGLGNDEYLVQAHCENAVGDHMETEYTLRQDQ
ncbi:MAG: hypothetical protein N3A55_10560 [Methylohalobius sp.]|nr:hypothetical protein [Methylohalobius sp.]